jgi:hypothetical protein
MRTTPIITIIRKYGLTSKRLNPKNRIKYEDAVKMVRQYESSDLKIADVIDNTRKTSHNNCHCGLPGCGQRIRYEYILVPKNEDTDKELVAGSTCVWPTLGMGELQKKEFFKLDTAIRDHYSLLDWRDSHAEVLDRLEKLKKADIPYFRPFWEEVETAPLLDEDTDFIMSVDVDNEVEKKAYQDHFRDLEDKEYEKLMDYVPKVKDYYKTNNFAQSLCECANTGRKLTGGQVRWLKVLVNRMWFDTKVKGTANDFSKDCADILKPIFDMFNYNGEANFQVIDNIELEVKNSTDKRMNWAWLAYKCQKAIVH